MFEAENRITSSEHLHPRAFLLSRLFRESAMVRLIQRVEAGIFISFTRP